LTDPSPSSEKRLGFFRNNNRWLLKEIYRMAAAGNVTLAQLQTDFATLQVDYTTQTVTINAVAANVDLLKTEVAALKLQVANGQTPDFSGIDASVNQLDNQVKINTANVTSEAAPIDPDTTTPPPVTEPPTDPGTGATEPPAAS
jgi:hypothetical protein